MMSRNHELICTFPLKKRQTNFQIFFNIDSILDGYNLYDINEKKIFSQLPHLESLVETGSNGQVLWEICFCISTHSNVKESVQI